MKQTFIMLACIGTMATPAFSENYQPPKPPEPPVVEVTPSGGNNAVAAVGLLAVLALVVLHANKQEQFAERPTTEPEPDFEKLLEEAGN